MCVNFTENQEEGEQQQVAGFSALDISKTVCFFAGDILHAICTRDALRRFEKPTVYPCCFIVQVTPKLHSNHWILLYLFKEENDAVSLFWFDSLALKPEDYGLRDLMESWADQVIYTNKQLQSESSENCAKFCVTTLYFLKCYFNPRTILELFNQDRPSHNENFVDTIWNHVRMTLSPAYSSLLLKQVHEYHAVAECTGTSTCSLCDFVTSHPKQKIVS